MKRKTYPCAALGAAALTGLLAAPLMAVGAGTAVAQGTVTTQGYTIGNGSVSGATATAEPNTAGATADYTVGFTTPSALAKGSSTLTLSAPNGRTIFPAASTDYFVVDNSSSSASQPVASATLGADGHSVALGLSASLAAKTSLSVYIQGVTNPTTPGPYSLNVSTSANPSPASTATYQIVAASLPPAFNPAAAPPLAGGLASYTIGAFQGRFFLGRGGHHHVELGGGHRDDRQRRLPHRGLGLQGHGPHHQHLQRPPGRGRGRPQRRGERGVGEPRPGCPCRRRG